MTTEQSNQLQALYDNLLEEQEKNYNVYCSIYLKMFDNGMGHVIATKQVYFYIYKRGNSFTTNIPSSLTESSSWKMQGNHPNTSSDSNTYSCYIYGFVVHSVQEV